MAESTTAAPTGFASAFARRRAAGGLALLPYLMAGYPSADATVELLARLADAGADGFELGIPFSDPLADGPTVQRAGQAALAGGMTAAGALEILRRARRTVDRPVALMGYMNPIVRFGVERFCRAAAEAGANALIVPDLPPEEAEELGGAAAANRLDLVQFVAPTTSPERLKIVARAARGFVYCVSVTGVTGARAELAAGVDAMLARIRAVTTTPVVVGFGISRPEHITHLVGRADGAIVASALIDAMAREPERAVAVVTEIVAGLRAAADGA